MQPDEFSEKMSRLLTQFGKVDECIVRAKKQRRLLLVVAIIGWALFGIQTARGETNVRPLLDAIRRVETGGVKNPANAIGDNGRSLGPYQIQRAYWKDSGVPGKYEQVRNRRYAERVVLGYWHRHQSAALRRADFEILARCHNGGPKFSRRATNGYWNMVRKELRNSR